MPKEEIRRDRVALQIILLFACAAILLMTAIVRPTDMTQFTFLLIVSVAQFIIFFLLLLIVLNKIPLTTKLLGLIAGMIVFVFIFFLLFNVVIPIVGNFEYSVAIYLLMTRIFKMEERGYVFKMISRPE